VYSIGVIFGMLGKSNATNPPIKSMKSLIIFKK
jgi:hypothetical protein